MVNLARVNEYAVRRNAVPRVDAIFCFDVQEITVNEAMMVRSNDGPKERTELKDIVLDNGRKMRLDGWKYFRLP